MIIIIVFIVSYVLLLFMKSERGLWVVRYEQNQQKEVSLKKSACMCVIGRLPRPRFSLLITSTDLDFDIRLFGRRHDDR